MKKLKAILESTFLPFVYGKSWSILLLAGMACLTTLNSCSSTQEEDNKGNIKQTSEALKVVVFGGAVTEGTSAKLDVLYDCFKWGTTTVNKVRETQTWWSILERILTDWVATEVEIISSGVAGNTAANGEARLEDDVLSHAPDYVLVMFGMDDALAGVGIDDFRKDLKKIVNLIEEGKAKVVLLTPPPISERMTVNCTMDELRQRQAHLSGLVQVIRDLAKEKLIPLIDFYQYFLDNRLAYDHLFEGWLPDGVAQSAMAPFIAGELLPVMGVNTYPNPILSDSRKVYSDAENPLNKHNAFTDLTYFKGEFFLAFRSGRFHNAPDQTTSKSEAIMVLRSRDAINWTEEAILKVKGLDNRDPKFLEIDGQLMVYTFAVCVKPCPIRMISYGFERISEGKWSEPFKCAPGAFWRPKKWRDKYIVTKQDLPVTFLSSPDGRNWKITSTISDSISGANETDLWTEGDELLAFSRVDREEGDLSMLVSKYIENENRWETVSSGRNIHAPKVFKVGEKLMISGRYMSHTDDRFRELKKDYREFISGTESIVEKVDIARVDEFYHGMRTGLFLMDGNRPRLLMEFLSASDGSYTGVVKNGNEYVMSDYSMHEYYPTIRRQGDREDAPCDIYISRIRFEQPEL